LQEIAHRLTRTDPKRGRLDELIAKGDGMNTKEREEFQILITSLASPSRANTTSR
jgi:hypothetical protein